MILPPPNASFEAIFVNSVFHLVLAKTFQMGWGLKQTLLVYFPYFSRQNKYFGLFVIV